LPFYFEQNILKDDDNDDELNNRDQEEIKDANKVFSYKFH